jgi:hypothetical protein
MGYKWKPSKAQKKEFAQKMQDSQFAADYYARKDAKREKKRSGSKYDYRTAGGEYTPTQYQHDMALKATMSLPLTQEEQNACNIVMAAYSCNEKTHHDNIHIVNELIRSGRL